MSKNSFQKSPIKYGDKPFVAAVPSHWECLKWTPAKLREMLKSPVKARTADDLEELNNERICKPKEIDLRECENSHFYVAYHRMSHNEDLCDRIPPWEELGLKDSGGDSCLWWGSRGAGTKLHQDSHGFNVVCQIYGKKEWTLAPPGCSGIKPTRCPYEPSTVWGRNISLCDLKDTTTIELAPGDMLVVPPGWWHSVVSLTEAISVNIWSPCPPPSSHDSDATETEVATRIITKLCSEARLFPVPIVEEECELGSIEQLSQLIKRDESITEESKVEKIEENHRFFHALTHPSVIKEFLKAYKEF